MLNGITGAVVSRCLALSNNAILPDSEVFTPTSHHPSESLVHKTITWHLRRESRDVTFAYYPIIAGKAFAALILRAQTAAFPSCASPI